MAGLRVLGKIAFVLFYAYNCAYGVTLHWKYLVCGEISRGEI